MHDIVVIQNQFGVHMISRFKSPVNDREELFSALNGFGAHKHLRTQIMLSMSVGDYIRIGQDWLRCDRAGWSSVSTEDMQNVINDVLGC